MHVTNAEISRSRLTENFRQLRALAQRNRYGSRCDLLAVVKGNAYGNGVSLCAPWLVAAGAQWLGITSVEEGVLVRQLCPGARILVMRGAPHASRSCEGWDEADALLDAQLTPTVWTSQHIQSLEQAANRRALAPGSIPVHLELDTGMSRQGASCATAELASTLDQLRAAPALRVEAVFTHFASAEELDAEQNVQQMRCFEQAVAQIAAAGFRPQWIHAANSSTLLGQRQMEPLITLANSVDANLLFRPGISLYGYTLPLSGDPHAKMPCPLEPVLAWKTAIASLRTVNAGARIGYNGTFTAPATMRLALLPLGYADGLNRKLSNRGHVLIRGIAAPIVGRVSMDLTTVDVTHVPGVQVDDEVVVIGRQNGQCITADDHARWAETISYEILCAIGARVPRLPCD